jgi:hypothetical protein
MSGRELKQVMSVIQPGKKGLYQVSGLSLALHSPNHTLINITFFNGTAIPD